MNKAGNCLLSELSDSDDTTDTSNEEKEFLEIQIYSLFIFNMMVQFLI